MPKSELPVPPHFDKQKWDKVWRVDYLKVAEEAENWRKKHNIQAASNDKFKVCLLLVDVQNTFCLPDFELFVAGRSGKAAVEDCKRTCEFIYKNLKSITQIAATMDTHYAMQIFHPVFLVDKNSQHPAPFTLISENDIKRGVWKFNPEIAMALNINEKYAQKYLQYYTNQLKKSGKYSLTVWPYHAMLGGIGHALVSSVEESIFFHSIARNSQADFQVKGNNPLTEHYSILGPEVARDFESKQIEPKNDKFMDKLLGFDAIIIAGQAKSHCVAWTINDLLSGIIKRNKELAKKIYLLEDCTSPVVVPGVVDYTEQADEAFRKFKSAGTNIVKSTQPIESWRGINLRQ